MKILEVLKTRAKIIKKDITVIYYAYRHPELSILPKILIIFTIGYALSPIDLIPDFIPVLGYLDDLIILPILITLSIKLIPQEIMTESRIKAENEPLKLKNNWLFGILFILIWIVLLTVIFKSVIKFFIK